MTAGIFIGRIGVLAVALGVGLGAASPVAAWADSDDASSSSSAEDTCLRCAAAFPLTAGSFCCVSLLGPLLSDFHAFTA